MPVCIAITSEAHRPLVRRDDSSQAVIETTTPETLPSVMGVIQAPGRSCR